MVVKASNFGDMLLSLPAYREAFLMAKAYAFNNFKNGGDIRVDFDGIKGIVSVLGRWVYFRG